jgi:C-terminal processing protease CtpA/Prc
MMKHKRFVSVVSFAVAVFCCGVLAETVQAVKPPNSGDRQIDLLQRNVPAKAANADLEMLQKIMVEMHPGLDIYATQKQFTTLVEQSRVQAGDTIKLREFFMRCARITDLVRCGHTYASVPLACQMKLQYATKMFPVPLLFIGEKAFVNHHQAKIPCGAEVLSINSVAMDEIVQVLMPLVTGDGYVNTFRYQFLGEMFAISYATAFGETKGFQVQYRTLKEEIKTTKVTGVSSYRLEQLMESVAMGGRQNEAYRMSRPREDTVLMAIDTFDNGQGSPPFRAYRKLVTKAFAMMHQTDAITNLILDLRQNDGGYTRSEMFLYSFLTNKPFKEMSSGQTNRNSIAFREFLSRNYQSRGVIKYFDRRLQKEMVAEDGQTWNLQDEWIVHGVPSEHRFRGKIYVLTGGRTHSAASAICTRLKEHSSAVFIGEETGGVEGVFTAGTTLYYELPNTGVELAVPILRYNNLTKMPKDAGRGIVPNHKVSIQPEDLLSGKDRVLDFTLELIEDHE